MDIVLGPASKLLIVMVEEGLLLEAFLPPPLCLSVFLANRRNIHGCCWFSSQRSLEGAQLTQALLHSWADTNGPLG